MFTWLKKIFIICFILGITSLSFAAFPPVKWKELDGSPSLYPTEILLQNSSIVITTGTIVELVSFGGGGSGGESTTVSDTTTIDLTLTGANITADGLYTAGDALTLTGADFDFDGGASPGGELGGTWASPTIDDSVAVTSWNLTTPTITTSLTTSTPTTLTVAELDRLDGLAGIITTDATACTDLEGVGLSIDTAVLKFAPTELEGITWGGGAAASIVWTANVSGTDTSVTFGSAVVTFSNGLTVTGTTTLGVLAGVIDASGATSVALPSGEGGRSLTVSGTAINADTELYTDTKCLYFETPVATDDFKSIWYAKQAFTITSIWAESDQTVTFMLQVDDGTPADVDSVDLAPAAGTAEDTSLDGDATMTAGDRLDLAVTSVANTPTWCSICFTGSYDD